MSKIPEQPRHNRGIKIAGQSAGGQWKAHVRTAASLHYASLDESAEQRNAIAERLALVGTVPASSVESATDPKFTDGIQTWWQQHLERMEQPVKGGAFAVMPDDYTPKESGGRALSGKRRTHRIRYSGAGVDLRMPSATAIRRFSAENSHRTFDVPVELGHEGGKVSGFVRVTEGAGGVWDVQALNFPGPAAGRAAESVAAVLEARRPTRALKDVEGQYEAQRRARQAGIDLPTSDGVSPLHQRRINRVARAGAEMQAPRVPSQLVTGGAYDQGTGTMIVSLNGRPYGYRVPQSVYQEVMRSDAPGRAYNDLVKGAKRQEVTECGKCHRWGHASVKHVCAPQPKGQKQGDRFRNKVASMLLKSMTRAA